MSIPTNTELYEYVKDLADKVYKKHSAYKSGFIVKTYKRLGGEYEDTDKPKTLKRWFKEKWMDVKEARPEIKNIIGNKKSYPVYRPTVRVNKETPKTFEEISIDRLVDQYFRKQRIKGKKNLPKF